jgi:hypothetical protein
MPLRTTSSSRNKENRKASGASERIVCACRRGVLTMSLKEKALAVVAIGLSAHLLLGPFRRGWSQMGTDFPNYYTAARLIRHGEPLRLLYDWTWFQRQIHYAGIDRQLGGYVPHTPATMLPFVPLTWLPPQSAKRAWLVLELLFLAAAVVSLSRLSGLSWLEVLVLALLAHAALEDNFLIGQYYIFILLLLTCAIGLLLRDREASGGALMGVIFALKLYTAPFLLLFAVRRQWRAFLSFVGAVAAIGVLTVAISGWRGVWYFMTTVMLRGLDGSVNDPYNPGWTSMTALLRHVLLSEAELNPHPLIQAPAAFFFLRAFYTLSVVGIALLVLSRRRSYQKPAHALAWFTIVLFVLSPNAASHHYILLLVPVALLLKEASRLWGAGLILLYVAVELPLFSWDARYFPKAWLLLALSIYAGSRCWSSVTPRALLTTVAAVAVLAAGETVHRMRLFLVEPPQLNSPAVIDASSNFSAFAAPTMRGLLYQAMSRESYVIRRAGASGAEEFSFDGDAFHPASTHSGEAIYFELVSGVESRIVRLRPETRDAATVVGPEWTPTEPAISPDGSKLAFISKGSLFLWEGDRHRLLASGNASAPAFFPDGMRVAFASGPPGQRKIAILAISGGEALRLARDQGDCTEPAISPDGRMLAFACEETGAEHIWAQDLSSGRLRRVTAGSCSNRAPAWSVDSRTIVFASDCSRGLGLSALYRAAVSGTL